MRTAQYLVGAMTTLAILFVAACAHDEMPITPTPLPAAPDIATANVYILPGAIDLGANAFGDEAVVIYKGERMRWRNVDSLEHNVVTDTVSLPEFMTTGLLAPGGERSFIMNTKGTARIHCTIHPQMVGTLVVQ